MAGKLVRREAGIGYLLLAPSLFGILAFLVFPILVVIWLSVNSWDLLSPAKFVGLENFADVFSVTAFRGSLLVTLLFVAHAAHAAHAVSAGGLSSFHGGCRCTGASA